MLTDILVFWLAASSVACAGLLGVLICMARTNGLDEEESQA